MFTAGIPILVSNGVFSLGGCIVIVAGRGRAVLSFKSLFLFIMDHGLRGSSCQLCAWTSLTARPQRFSRISFRFALRG